MDLEQLMKKLGEEGVHLLVRYNPEREKNKFIIIINSIRLCDCDNPTEKLADYYDRLLHGDNKSIGL